MSKALASSFVGWPGTKQQQKVANKITHAQGAQVIQRQDRQPEIPCTSAEGRVKGGPKTNHQKKAMHEVQYECRQGDAQLAGIAEIRGPFDGNQQQRNERSHGQQQSFLLPVAVEVLVNQRERLFLRSEVE